ncbi:cytosol aminopeptidase family, catalytic domain-containing protein [Suillus subalutaceus]|uniref:cytosol aminopeptidase family, catalytic domain-containing protein n=1 Tax=Suillus subalutaceus TaxID=48586 RepID=UPI001B8828B8|nr:cytosol aminopeptidase family, catalytic domain-containing protein [Suillus subalutaceus]KAG1838197.1 cytosol aminopeptidase family, catalytic domain-containing protein [Suillus subalutaceus]
MAQQMLLAQKPAKVARPISSIGLLRSTQLHLCHLDEIVRKAIASGINLKSVKGLSDGASYAVIDASTNPHAAVLLQGVAAHLALYNFSFKTSPPSAFDPWGTAGVQNIFKKTPQIPSLPTGIMNLSRTLMELPVNMMTRTAFCERAKTEFIGIPNVEIIVRNEACEVPLDYLLQFDGCKSHYKDACSKDAQPLAFVGKGISFGIGGTRLKPSALRPSLFNWKDMKLMRGDMGIIRTELEIVSSLLAIAQLQLPINLVTVTPICENLPGPKAIKPDDVIYAIMINPPWVRLLIDVFRQPLFASRYPFQGRSTNVTSKTSKELTFSMRIQEGAAVVSGVGFEELLRKTLPAYPVPELEMETRPSAMMVAFDGDEGGRGIPPKFEIRTQASQICRVLTRAARSLLSEGLSSYLTFVQTRGVQGVQRRVSTVGTAQLSIAHLVFGGLTKVQTGAVETAASIRDALFSRLTGALKGPSTLFLFPLHLEVFLGVLEEFGWVNFGFFGDREFEEVVIGWLDLEATIILEGGAGGVLDIPDIGGDTEVNDAGNAAEWRISVSPPLR